MTADLERAPATSELEAYMRQADMLARSTLVPQQYRGKPADVLVAALAGREVGLGPVAAMQYVVVINGKPTMNAEGRVGLIRRAGHSISGESSAARAVVHGKRRDTGDEMTVEWTIDMAKRAELVKRGPWTQYPEAMLWARAVSQLSRMLFADVLMGVSYDPEEMGATVDRHGDVIDVPAIDPPAVLPPALQSLIDDIDSIADVDRRQDVLDEISMAIYNQTGVPIEDTPENWFLGVRRIIDKAMAA